MTFVPKTWVDEPATTTPIDASGLINLETRLSAYTDTQVATSVPLTNVNVASGVAKVGSDGYVGTPGQGGTQLSPKAVVITGTPTNGQVPEWNSGSSEWVPATGTAGVTITSTDSSIAVSGTTTAPILQVSSSLQTSIAESLKQLAPSSQSGASYTFVLTDAGTTVEGTSSSAQTFTIPVGVFSVGTEIKVCQYGTGQITIAAASGVTIFSPNAAKSTSAQYATITLRQHASNIWILSGSLNTGGGNTTAYDSLMASLSPTGWWPLTDLVGSSTAADASGHGYTGTVSGTVTFGETSTAVIGNKTASIGGTGAYGNNRIQSDLTIAGGTTALTANILVYLPSWTSTTDYCALLTSSSDSSNVGFGITCSLNTTTPGVIFYVGNGTSLVNAYGASVGVGWHMLTLIVSGGNMTGYLDGTAVQAAQAVSPSWGSGDVTIGNSPGGGGDFVNTGFVSEAAVWVGTALTGTNLTNLLAQTTI